MIVFYRREENLKKKKEVIMVFSRNIMRSLSKKNFLAGFIWFDSIHYCKYIVFLGNEFWEK